MNQGHDEEAGHAKHNHQRHLHPEQHRNKQPIISLCKMGKEEESGDLGEERGERESDEKRERERITSNILTLSRRQTSIKQFPLYKMGGGGGVSQDTGEERERESSEERGRESLATPRH